MRRREFLQPTLVSQWRLSMRVEGYMQSFGLSSAGGGIFTQPGRRIIESCLPLGFRACSLCSQGRLKKVVRAKSKERGSSGHLRHVQTLGLNGSATIITQCNDGSDDEVRSSLLSLKMHRVGYGLIFPNHPGSVEFGCCLREVDVNCQVGCEHLDRKLPGWSFQPPLTHLVD
jgi:hypothetical protein